LWAAYEFNGGGWLASSRLQHLKSIKDEEKKKKKKKKE
jgi:hypothetical protein